MPGISFDRAAEYYDATRGYAAGTAELIRDAIVAYTGAGQETRFLELGVGTGRIALPFIRAEYDYTGVDISEAMMNRLNLKLAEDENLADYRHRLLQADITDLPFEDASFEIILSVHVLHLIPNWQAAIEEARRVLNKPNGYFLLAYDHVDFDKEVTEDLPAARVRREWEKIIKELGAKGSQRRPGVHTTDEKLTAHLQETGATTEVVTLVEHQFPAQSARDRAEQLKARLYSSDWSTSDEVHQEASRRLDDWLQTEVADPDRAVATSGEFKALVARWSY